MPVYDYRSERVWRHLDSMEYPTFIHCRLPRVKMVSGNIHTIDVSWADSGVSHTKKFENKSIQVLQATHCQKVAAENFKTSAMIKCVALCIVLFFAVFSSVTYRQ